MRNYDLIYKLLEKWPVNETRGTRCFGNHLRELVRKSFPSGHMFAGSEAENKKKLLSLLRLADNIYGEKYAYRKQTGASGYKCDYISKLLADNSSFQGFNKISC